MYLGAAQHKLSQPVGRGPDFGGALLGKMRQRGEEAPELRETALYCGRKQLLAGGAVSEFG